MLHLNDVTYRLGPRLILDRATAAIPEGHKIGLVGRNGAGKTTLLRLILGEIAPSDGGINKPRNARIGGVAQEAPGGLESLIATVLAADGERTVLLAEAETTSDPYRIADIQTRLADMGAHAAPARAAAILAGLGFDEAAQSRPCAEFSGGWRMRVALASILFAAPEILLLDEPTNYLDLEGALWLENFLKTYPGTILIVSHDRDLLNSAVDQILHLHQGKLTLYAGGYDDFEEARRERQRLDLKLKKRQDDERRRIEAFIDRFRAKNTKARQAQSRVKALARMQPIAAEIDEFVVPFRIPDPQKKLGNPLLRLESASVGYEPDRPILKALNLSLAEDDRIGLLGQNGNGKSTLAKLIAGRLQTMDGARRASKKLEVAYFAQHQLDELAAGRSPFDHMKELMPDATESQRRARLGAMGFGADKADTKTASLSGGEKARLLLGLATFREPHLLVLDEPTNHLDVDSREALIRALNDYAGALIVVSHDRHLLGSCVDRLWLVRDGGATPFDDDLEAYRKVCLAERGRGPGGGLTASDGRPSIARFSRADQRRETASRRASLAPLKKRARKAEKEVERLGGRIANLDDALGDASLYDGDGARAAELSKERGLLARQLAEAEERWLAEIERYETAMAEAAE